MHLVSCSLFDVVAVSIDLLIIIWKFFFVCCLQMPWTGSHHLKKIVLQNGITNDIISIAMDSRAEKHHDLIICSVIKSPKVTATRILCCKKEILRSVCQWLSYANFLLFNHWREKSTQKPNTEHWTHRHFWAVKAMVIK